MSANADQILYWNETAGAKWVRHQQSLDALMAPLTDALLIAADPRAGEKILDVGCGCGELALRLSEAVGPGGQVSAVDVSKPMLACAAARDAGGLSSDRAPIRWIEADASAHQYEPDRDLITSRFGVMFFDDRRKAFANLHAAGRAEGRFSFLAWRSRSEVEWMQAPLDWISSVLPPAEDLPDGGVGPFALADGEATMSMLTEAGFRDVAAERLDRSITIGATLEAAVELLCHTGPAAAAVRNAGSRQQGMARDLLSRALENRVDSSGRVSLGAGCWIFSGRC